MRDPKELKNHPLNIKLYGEVIPPELEASIASYGIKDALIVCRSKDPDLDNMIVSGRRRRICAMKLDINKVPCIEREYEDDSELRMDLMILNVRAELSTAQRTAMYLEMSNIEEERAKARRNGGVAVPAAEKGVAKDKAARSVGMSRTTAEAAGKVLKTAEKLADEGRQDEAKFLVETLDTQSVSAATRAAEIVTRPAGQKPDKKNPETAAVDRAVTALVVAVTAMNVSLKSLVKAIDEKHDASEEFGKSFRKFESMTRELGEGIEFPILKSKAIKTEWDKAKERLGNK